MNATFLRRLFRKTNSFIFTKLMKPIGNLGISCTYYTAYFVLYLIGFFFETLLKFTNDKEKKQKWQRIVDSLPFPHPDVYR